MERVEKGNTKTVIKIEAAAADTALDVPAARIVSYCCCLAYRPEQTMTLYN